MPPGFPDPPAGAPPSPPAAPGSGHAPAYWRPLDGVRGLAIVLVMLFHSRCPYLPGGFVGVDVFFVLSGFLITVRLNDEKTARGRLHYGRFLVRRALRLAPALWLMVGAYLLFELLVGTEARLPLLDALLAVTYVSNWTRAAGLEHPDYLGHTWSLSIEEQFYVLWPLALLALWRLVPRASWRVVLVLACAVLVAAARVLLMEHGVAARRLYNGLDTHADALLVGCALALARDSPFRRWTRVGTGAALGALVGLAWIAGRAQWDGWWVLAAGYPFVAALSALVIAHGAHASGTVVTRLLATGPMAGLGRISYGVYLWHYPVMRVLEAQHYTWPVVALAGMGVSIAIAALSYWLVEQRFLRLKEVFAPRP